MTSGRPAGRRWLGTAEVAGALGVSVSTVKRWIDEGIMPAQRSAGGHRRLLGEEVARALRDRGFTALDLDALTTARPLSSMPVRAFTKALRGGDERVAMQLLRDVRAAGTPMTTVADDLIAPAMHAIGHGCEIGTLDVSQEHRATHICVAALEAIKTTLTPPAKDAPRAVGAAPGGDPYVLPSLLVEMVLRESGWDAVDLGANTPLPALASAVARARAQLVWISLSYVADRARLIRECTRFRTGNAALIAGGRVLTRELRQALAGAAFGENMRDLSRFARAQRRARPRRSRDG